MTNNIQYAHTIPYLPNNLKTILEGEKNTQNFTFLPLRGFVGQNQDIKYQNINLFKNIQIKPGQCVSVGEHQGQGTCLGWGLDLQVGGMQEAAD